MNADEISSVNGHNVCVPDFQTKGNGKKVIITINDDLIVQSVSQKLETLGYKVIVGTAFLKQNNRTLENLKNEQEQMLNNTSDFERELMFNISKRDFLAQTGYEELYATLQACKYVIQNNIKGDFVECGVWRRGDISRLNIQALRCR